MGVGAGDVRLGGLLVVGVSLVVGIEDGISRGW